VLLTSLCCDKTLENINLKEKRFFGLIFSEVSVHGHFFQGLLFGRTSWMGA
jgi:hypothetical protein